jgi:hypothetical protein
MKLYIDLLATGEKIYSRHIHVPQELFRNNRNVFVDFRKQDILIGKAIRRYREGNTFCLVKRKHARNGIKSGQIIGN